MVVTSLARGASQAWSLAVDCGRLGVPVPASLPHHGTRIEVRDLFCATPARLKFLRSDGTEYGAIMEVVERLALAWPQVAFTLNEDGRRPWRVEACADSDSAPGSLARLRAVLGESIGESALSVNAERGSLRLEGTISLPTANQATARHQYLFVNGRPLRDRSLLGAVRAGYGDLIPHGRFPMVALFLDVPPREVDVNVHPAKTEVRFRDTEAVRSLIVGGLRARLAQESHRTSGHLSTDALSAFQPSFQAPSPHIGGGARYASSYAGRGYAGMGDARPGAALTQGSLALAMQAAEPLPGDFPAPVEQAQNWDETGPLGIPRAQLHRAYIVAETPDGMILVDQHAAHERLLHERLKAAIQNGALASQGLLTPEVVELDIRAAEALSAHLPELTSWGFEVERFGDAAVLVRAIPALLQGRIEISSLLRDLAEEILEHGEGFAVREGIEHRCATIACHGAIRAGTRLNLAQMDALLRDMEQTPHSGQCNHGRPTHITLCLADIEKLFERR